MHIKLERKEDNLQLHLGVSWINLNQTDALHLQEQLAKLQPTSWQLTPATWQQAKDELESLPSLLRQLLGLGKSLQAEVINQLSLDACLALSRFARKETPALQQAESLSKKIKQTIKQSLATKSLKNDFSEALKSPDKSSVLEVAQAQQDLIQYLKSLGIKPKLDTPAPKPEATEPSLEELQARAKNYLAYLARLPSVQVKIILKNLAPVEIGWLVSACKSLGITEFNQKLAAILPPASWQKLSANCPAGLAPDKLSHLLASLGMAFKELHKHLQKVKQND